MWILLFLVPFSLLGLFSCVVLGGPRRYSLISAALGLLLLWGWLELSWWAALIWLLLFGGLRLGLLLDYQSRRRGTDRGATGATRYLSVLSHEVGKRGLVIWLPPLKGPLFWAAKRVKGPLPGAPAMPGGMQGSMLLPVLQQIFGNSRGFRIDTRQLPGKAMGAMEIRCD
jgi:hypothetical protein